MNTSRSELERRRAAHPKAALPLFCGSSIALLLSACILDRSGSLLDDTAQGGMAPSPTASVQSSSDVASSATSTAASSSSSASGGMGGQTNATGVGGFGGGGSTGSGGSGGSGGSPPLDPCLATIPDVAAVTCSANSSSEASLTITNQCPMTTVKVYWVDYSCQENLYGSAGPNGVIQLAAYETHPWRIRNATTGELLREIPPLTGDTSVSFP